MNKLFILLKTNILNSFKIRSTSAKKKVLIFFLALYIVGTLVITFGMFLNGLFETLSNANLITYYIPLLFAITSLFSFFFTIYSAKSGLFESKDNDLLLSLPIKRSTILLNRLLYITLYNFAIGLLFLVPGIYIYFSSVAVNGIFYLSIVLLLIFLPVIPTILASLFGYIVANLISKTNRKNMFELLYYTLFIFIYLLVMANSNKILLSLTTNIELLNKILKYLFLPIFLLSKGIIENNFIYILLFVIINLICLLLFVLVLNKNYFKVLSKLSAEKTKSNFKMHTIVLKSKKRALREKELKRYFSSAIYVFNTAFGVVFIAIAGVASLFVSQEKILSLVGTNMEINLTPFSMIFFGLLFVLSLTDTTNSSISIERNNFWIMKSLPLKTEEIFDAKIYVNKIITMPIIIISLLLFSISGYITLLEVLLFAVMAYFINDFIANFGLIVNLYFPKFDALNDNVIVKQSFASMLGIMVPFVLIMIVIGLLGTVTITNIVLMIVIGVSLLLSIISKIFLLKVGTKKFYKLG